MLWNLALVGFIIWIGKRHVLRPGRLFAIYVGGYFTGRLWVEALRADEANTYFGLRINIWISLLCIAGTLLFLALRGLRRRPDDSDEPYRDGHRFGDAVSEPATGDAAEHVRMSNAEERGRSAGDRDPAAATPAGQRASGGADAEP
jgi:hypothetical protein